MAVGFVELLARLISLASVLHMYKTIYALFRMQICRKDGPFYHCLFSALANFNVERQAYHGNTVVGNHVHKMLKVTKLRCCNIPFQPTSIDASCRHIEEVGERTGTTEAKDITVKFKRILNLFGLCHCRYNCGAVTVENVKKTSKDSPTWLIF